MIEIIGNIWDYHKIPDWIVVTTNGTLKRDKTAVMGRGIALQAATKFPDLPAGLGEHISLVGKVLATFPKDRIICFPVKHHWWEKADFKLITNSAYLLSHWAKTLKKTTKVYLPRPGCGNGGLLWQDVKPILERYLDDQFIVVEIKND